MEMKVVYVSTTSLSKTEDGKKEMAKRHNFLGQIAPPYMQIDIIDNPEGPPSIQTLADEYYAVPGTLRAIKSIVDNYDGIIVGCFGDPGLEAIREVVDIPVIGPGSSSMHIANQLGKRFSILSPVPSTIPSTRDLAEMYGLGRRLTSVRSLNIPVLEIRKDREKALKKAIEVAESALKNDGADTLILGCMSMAFQNFADEMGKALNVPVVNPIVAAVKTIDLLILGKLHHSPLVYKL